MLYKLFVLLLCGGCSVQPLHKLQMESRESQLSSNIFVNVIAGKRGQTLRGYIQDCLRDLPITNEHYVLTVSLTENYIPFAFADDGNAQRLKVLLIANLSLSDHCGNVVLDTPISASVVRNVANSQADVLLSMYDQVSDTALKNLAFRIVENLKVVLSK